MKKNEKIALVVVLILIAIFACITAFVKLNIGNEFELKMYNFINAPWSDTATKVITIITNIIGKYVLAAIVVVSLIFKKSRIKFTVPMIFSVGGAVVVKEIFKHIVKRPRPTILPLAVEDGFSFPSGHAAIAAALAVTLIYFICKNMKNGVLRNTLLVLVVLFPFVISFTRVYLGVHYFFDVTAGLLVGVGSAIACNTVINRFIYKENEDK